MVSNVVVDRANGSFAMAFVIGFEGLKKVATICCDYGIL